MKLRLGEILIAENKIDEAQLKAALAYQRRWGKKLGDCIVDLNFISELELIQCLSKHLRVPMIDVTRIEASKITKSILDQIDLQSVRRHRIVPLAIKEIKKKKRLVVATSDPTNYKVFDEIQFRAGLPLLLMVAPDSDIDWFIRKYYLNESEALPFNYVSGISIIEDSNADGHKGPPDPISTIFFDENFTAISRMYRPESKVKVVKSEDDSD